MKVQCCITRCLVGPYCDLVLPQLHTHQKYKTQHYVRQRELILLDSFHLHKSSRQNPHQNWELLPEQTFSFFTFILDVFLIPKFKCASFFSWYALSQATNLEANRKDEFFLLLENFSPALIKIAILLGWYASKTVKGSGGIWASSLYTACRIPIAWALKACKNNDATERPQIDCLVHQKGCSLATLCTLRVRLSPYFCNVVCLYRTDISSCKFTSSWNTEF